MVMRLFPCKHAYAKVCPVCDMDTWDQTLEHLRISKETYAGDVAFAVEVQLKRAERRNALLQASEEEASLPT